MLIDRARIYVKGGGGGKGSKSFRREKYVPRGGPDGGDGGRGGDVELRVRENLTTLLPFQYNQRFLAESGEAGMKRQKYGKSGSRLYVDVPPGTVVWDDASDQILADLTEPDETFVVARGGKGGRGNVHFKSATHQAPRLAELGEPGEERTLRLELRLIADVGLVGLPNAGKSTLLGAASAAQPKIADYPFTTLEPNLGVVQIGGRSSGQSFVLADIPGLIEGAAGGAGLGHEFLRHVTRTKVLIHVLDASGGLEGRDPLDDFRVINAELAAYDGELSAKRMLVALNKIDLTEAVDRVERLSAALADEGYRVHSVSAGTGHGVPELMAAVSGELRDFEETAAEAEEKPQDRRIYRLETEDARAWKVVRRSNHHYAIEGSGIERFTKMTDFGNDDAVVRFQRVLEGSGIADELARQEVAAGDIVHVAGHELVWGEQDDLEPAGGAERRARRRG